MSGAVDPDVTLRPDEVAAMTSGRPGTCHHCRGAGVWQSVRFKRKDREIWLLLVRDDELGRVVWWDGEFVALRPGDEVRAGVATWRAHGKECQVAVADAEHLDAEDQLLEVLGIAR